MQILEEVPLKDHSTMQLGGKARYFVEVTSENELKLAHEFAVKNNLQIHILGAGSNTIFQDSGFNGLVIANRICGISESTVGDSFVITAGAGENWDDISARSVELGYSDIAALGMIPGTVGAAPVQNIGAYGQQISDSIISVRAYEISTKSFVEITNEECEFIYRGSRFNTKDKGSFVITSLKMRLSRKSVKPPFYADIEKYFAKKNIDLEKVTPRDLRKAVIEVRSHKLPDPSVVANCGSFFKNPVISGEEFNNLKRLSPEITLTPEDWTQPPYWELPNSEVKLAAGWLVEQAGFKDFHDEQTGMATWKNQSLVLVNESAKHTDDLIVFKERIVNAVKNKFGITLLQEPELVAA